MLIISNMGDHVWLMTSRHTDPDLLSFRHALANLCIQADEPSPTARVHLQLIDVWVKDAVDEADAGRLVGICIGQFDVHFPQTSFKGRCRAVLVETAQIACASPCPC